MLYKKLPVKMTVSFCSFSFFCFSHLFFFFPLFHLLLQRRGGFFPPPYYPTVHKEGQSPQVQTRLLFSWPFQLEGTHNSCRPTSSWQLLLWPISQPEKRQAAEVPTNCGGVMKKEAAADSLSLGCRNLVSFRDPPAYSFSLMNILKIDSLAFLLL